MDTQLLETEYRRARITAFPSRIAADTDIVAVVTGTHAASGRRLRAYSVHLDSERTSNRTRELRAVFADASSGF